MRTINLEVLNNMIVSQMMREYIELLRKEEYVIIIKKFKSEVGILINAKMNNIITFKNGKFVSHNYDLINNVWSLNSIYKINSYSQRTGSGEFLIKNRVEIQPTLDEIEKCGRYTLEKEDEIEFFDDLQDFLDNYVMSDNLYLVVDELEEFRKRYKDIVVGDIVETCSLMPGIVMSKDGNDIRVRSFEFGNGVYENGEFGSCSIGNCGIMKLSMEEVNTRLKLGKDRLSFIYRMSVNELDYFTKISTYNRDSDILTLICGDIYVEACYSKKIYYVYKNIKGMNQEITKIEDFKNVMDYINNNN